VSLSRCELERGDGAHPRGPADFGSWPLLCVVACLGPVRYAAVLVAYLENGIGW
jgi:hypothetical protein